MAIPFLKDVDLKQNELQNAVLQNLASAPASPVAGQTYFNTTDNLQYIYDGSEWVTGKTYSAGNGLTLSGTEFAIDETVVATKTDIEDFITLEDLSVAAGSANYMTYSTENGTFALNVDTAVTASSNNLVTSGAVDTAIANAIVGGVNYQGTFSATGQTDYSAIALPVKKGYLYYVSAGEDVTIGGTVWNQGDFLLINKDVAASGTIGASDVQKIDNTESTDIVRLNAAQTLTNKTISGADNTVTNLPFSALADGVVVSTIAGTASASATKMASELAIATAIDSFITADSVDTLTNKTIDANATGNSISNLEVEDFASGVIVTTVAGTASASDTKMATEKAVANGLAVKTEKFSAQNGVLTATAGVCTWSISNTIGSADVLVQLFEVATGTQVMAEVAIAASTITVKMNSAADIAANTYKAVVIGL